MNGKFGLRYGCILVTDRVSPNLMCLKSLIETEK